MLKGHLDAVVLAALEAGPAHGYAIIETIRTRSSEVFDLPEGAVYPDLHRLEQAGVFSSTWTIPPSGRRRRVYALTKAGSAALRERRKSWNRFAQAIDAFLGGPRAWPAWVSSQWKSTRKGHEHRKLLSWNGMIAVVRRTLISLRSFWSTRSRSVRS
jgi:PadR family transcriptional regulator, regulatory protein PadR